MKPTIIDDKEKTAIIVDESVEVRFPFDWDKVNAVKTITGRKWDDGIGAWKIPATPWHYSKIIEVLGPLGFYIDPAIAKGADQKAPPPKHKYPSGLYPFQRVGVDFLYQAGGRAILADEMGLGKTITSLAFVHTFGGRTLVVCPANVVYKWGEEISRWMPTRNWQIIETGKVAIEDKQVIIMSYAMMVIKYDELLKQSFDVVIYDEGHYLKSYKAQRTRVAKSLVERIPKIIFLSGTPFLNHPGELFSLLNMLDPVGFDNYFKYAIRYCGAQKVEGSWYFPKDQVTNIDELSSRLSRIMLRRTKQDPAVALDLPELTRSSIPVKLSNAAEYRAAMKDVNTWLKGKDRSVINPKHALTKLNVLRQVVGEGKVAAAIELAEGVLQDDKKVVLFAHHKDVVDALVQGLKPYGVLTIVGDTPQKRRQENVNLFLSKDLSVRVMICSTAGSEGINLFSASDIIFVEREWTPAKEEQMEARLHRIGQKSNVNAMYLVAKGTVDEKLDRLVKTKRAVIGQVISQDEIITKLLEEL